MKKIYFLFALIIVNSYSCNGLNNNNQKNSQTYIDTIGCSGRAYHYYWNGDYLNAKLCYDTLILYDSSKGEYFFRRGYSKSMLLRDDVGAINDYLQSIRLNFKKTSALVNIGVLYRSVGKYDSAIYFYNKCLELDPNNIAANREINQVKMILNN